MNPIDQVKPVVPGNWVRRVGEKQRKPDPKKDPRQDRDQKPPVGQDPDGRPHIIDDLA